MKTKTAKADYRLAKTLPHSGIMVTFKVAAFF